MQSKKSSIANTTSPITLFAIAVFFLSIFVLPKVSVASDANQSGNWIGNHGNWAITLADINGRLPAIKKWDALSAENKFFQTTNGHNLSHNYAIYFLNLLKEYKDPLRFAFNNENTSSLSRVEICFTRARIPAEFKNCFDQFESLLKSMQAAILATLRNESGQALNGMAKSVLRSMTGPREIATMGLTLALSGITTAASAQPSIDPRGSNRMVAQPSRHANTNPSNITIAPPSELPPENYFDPKASAQ